MVQYEELRFKFLDLGSKLKELANKYNSFAGKEDEVEGKVKFIFLVDSVKKDKDGKNEAVIEKNIMPSKENENKNIVNESSGE